MVRRTDSSPPSTRPPVPGSPESQVGDESPSIDSWLGMLMTLLHLPEGRRQAICAELSVHLHERVRDLVLNGRDEASASRIALTELGEAADLARRLEQAHRLPRRRLIMNMAIVGVGAVVVAGVLTFGPAASTGDIRAAVFPGEPATELQLSSSYDETRVVVPAGGSLRDLIEAIGEAADETLLVQWSALEDQEVDVENPVSQKRMELSLRRACALAAELASERGAFEWRFGPETIELAPQATFDRRERQLVSYQVGRVFESLCRRYDLEYDDAAERVCDLIQTLVDPDLWEDNGGTVALLKIVGGTMFVQAPPRMHSGVAWILGELESGAMPGALAPDDDGAIKVGDRVTVEIYELFAAGQWFGVTRRVGATGLLHIPEVGDVPALGLTESALADAIETRLTDVIMKPLVVVVAGEDAAVRFGREQAAAER